MKVYFGTSPRIKKRFPESVKKIFDLIIDLGHEHVTNWVRQVDPDNFYESSSKTFGNHYKKTISEIRKSDICVFEASLHSLSVGYLVNYALESGSPVVVLSQGENIPFMLESINSNKLFFVLYDEKNLAKKLKKALKKAEDKVDVRFNFFITSPQLAYLDWISQRKRVPRSVYLRGLIEADMKANKNYQ